MYRIVRCKSTLAKSTISMRKDGKLSKIQLRTGENNPEQAKIEALTKADRLLENIRNKQQVTHALKRSSLKLSHTDRYEFKMVDEKQPIQKFIQGSANKETFDISEYKRMKILDDVEHLIWRKYNRYVELSKQERKFVTCDTSNQQVYERTVEKGPYVGMERIFKPSFGRHQTLEYRIQVARELGDWNISEKVVDTVVKRFNVVLHSEFAPEFVEKTFGQGLTKYIDKGLLRAEEVKEKRKLTMSEEEEEDWKSVVEQKFGVITLKGMQYGLKSASKSKYIIFDARRLEIK